MEVPFRTGSGIAFGDFVLHGMQATFTRPVFANHLTQHWLPALPDVQEKLSSGERVRIAEVGCGEGLAAIAIAKTYPNAIIDGYDLDEASIAVSCDKAADAGVVDQLRFEVRDAADPGMSMTTTSSSRSRCCTTCPIRLESCRP